MKQFDDWYVVEEIAPGVFAIGEPKYHQLNWSYLIAGREQALMFDTGPGERDIAPVARAHTDKPVTAMPSHLHFDHVGNLKSFDRVLFADLPVLRAMERDGLVHAPEGMVLGAWENRFWTPVRACGWAAIGGTIDLGGLALDVVHTPGHSPESVSLWAPRLNILFAADVLYPGPLYAQIPNADLPGYLDTAERLAALVNDETVILCGHGDTAETPAPRMARSDLQDIARALNAMRDGRLRPTSDEPLVFPVNDRMSLLASDAAFGPWQRPPKNI